MVKSQFFRRLRQDLIQHVLEFDQTLLKNNFFLGTKNNFSEFFVYMTCMTRDTKASSFPNLHEFAQKIMF